MSYSSPQSAVVAAGIGATLQLFRVSFDLISTASQRAQIQESKLQQDGKKNTTDNNSEAASAKGSTTNLAGISSATAESTTRPRTPRSSSLMFFNGRFSLARSKPTLMSKRQAADGGGDVEAYNKTTTDTNNGSSSYPAAVTTGVSLQDEVEPDQQAQPQHSTLIYTAALLNFLLFCYFLVACILNATNTGGDEIQKALYDAIPLGCAAVGFFFAGIMNYRDFYRTRFTSLQRTLQVLSSLVFAFGIIVLIVMEQNNNNNDMTVLDICSLTAMILFCLMAFAESKILPYPLSKTSDSSKKARLSKRAILTVLKPYFWPDATATSATLNRFRAMMTWVCVAAAKTCNLIGPIFLGRASTALSRLDYSECIKYSIVYALCNFGSSFFKESQSLIYLKVAQAAFVQLSEVSFKHLHSLSLDWHLRKKLGETIRMMDRGILACDTLMKFAFLWLLPAIAECILVVIIFATYFDYFPLGVSVFFFVFTYMIMTIVITLWRKKFRKQVAKSDNDWHDRCTDSLVNFETVKYFTGEDYEMKRFGDAVKTYQSGSVNVAASLGLLNISQQVLLQTCLATSLTLATISIRDRSNCCMTNGCEDGNSQCCSDLSNTCPGMEVGDFVAVLTYTIQLFLPLNFLGSVYNAIVMALVDLTNLSELLAESPDVSDASDAIELPPTNTSDPDTAAEFDNVIFHYPSQPETSGLKGVSFRMKRGTTTAVVGSTGAGKTTVSRLLFRFYDVVGGAVKVNGVDVRTVKQKSLREHIGVVPQATTMFNDTIGNNIRYGKREATDEDLDEVAEAAQLTNFVESLPDGWDTMVGDRGLKLSGGEKQRTAIARCLLKNPPIVILDEATSALDTLTEASVQEALDRLGTNRTVLVIAHRLGTIRNADNIIVLEDGRVAEEGTHNELLDKGGKYADMWNMQLTSTRSSQASFGLSTDD